MAVILILLPFSILAQKENNIWCFGDSAGIDWNEPQNPTFFESASRYRGSCSSIADSTGNLLFYCANIEGDGLICPTFKRNYIYNKNHDVMENGACLPGVGWYYEHTIIPAPESDSLFYVFSVDNRFSISYNVIDITANDGLGKVIERDHQLETPEDTIFESIYYSWSIDAIKHGNGRDWWVIAKSTYAAPIYQYYLFLVTPEGVTTTYIPDVGNENLGIDQLIFNHTGDKFYNVGFYGQLQEYNFNRCNGDLTLNRTLDTLTYIQIDENNAYTRAYFGAELSPNDRFLYISTLPWEECSSEKGYLLQFDLWDENPIETIDTLSIYGDALDGPDDFRTAGSLKLAPDGKIYLSRGFQSCTLDEIQYPDTLYTTSNTNLSVINNPDSLGAAANFEEYSFYLGGNRTYKGLPNNPNYNLESIPECDTLTSGIKTQKQFLKKNFNIFPNPCYNNCILEYKPAKEKGNIAIATSTGKIVFTEKNIPVTLLQHGYEVNLSGFAKGIYTVTLVTGKEVVTKKLVKL
jgi:Secretion system C-terminal sorting domain